MRIPKYIKNFLIHHDHKLRYMSRAYMEVKDFPVQS